MLDVTLRVLDGADRGRVYERLPTPITIGREEGNAVQLNDERISRYHLKIQEDQGKLVLTDLENVLESGVDVTVTVPGKKTRDLLQLSGGERALTASAILFAMLKVKPSPFVILDEVDAPLDDSNIGRYGELLREFAQQSQFIIITHNKGTMEAADTLYGVTIEEPGVSRLLGVRLRDDTRSGNGEGAATVAELVGEESPGLASG